MPCSNMDIHALACSSTMLIKASAKWRERQEQTKRRLQVHDGQRVAAADDSITPPQRRPYSYVW